MNERPSVCVCVHGTFTIFSASSTILCGHPPGAALLLLAEDGSSGARDVCHARRLLEDSCDVVVESLDAPRQVDAVTDVVAVVEDAAHALDPETANRRGAATRVAAPESFAAQLRIVHISPVRILRASSQSSQQIPVQTKQNKCRGS